MLVVVLVEVVILVVLVVHIVVNSLLRVIAIVLLIHLLCMLLLFPSKCLELVEVITLVLVDRCWSWWCDCTDVSLFYVFISA